MLQWQAVSLFEDVAASLSQSDVSRDAVIVTPFGERLLTYADLTASGRSLEFVETLIRRIRPYYANVHTSSSTIRWSSGDSAGEISWARGMARTIRSLEK